MRSVSSSTKSLVERIRELSFALGFESRRVPRITRRDRLARSQVPRASGLTIELIGTSAVGKSMFLEHLRKTSSHSDEYAVLRRMFRVQRRSLSKSRWTESDQQWLDLWALNQEIEGHSWVHPCDLDSEHSRFLRDGRMIQSLQASRPLVVDHSLSHFFGRALRACQGVNEELFAELMHQRVVVVCRADPTIILQRLRQRNERFVSRVLHIEVFPIDRSDEELLERIRTSLRSWLDYGEFLASRGVPVLVLNLVADHDVPKRMLREFIGSLA